jgi:hypothetical protein
VGIAIASTNSISQIFNRPVSFNAKAGREYGIALSDASQNVAGFTWTIQNSPLVVANLTTNHYATGRPVEVTPIAFGPLDRIASVDFVDNGDVIFSSSEPPFSGTWVINSVGSHTLELRITLTDATVITGGYTSYVVSPAISIQSGDESVLLTWNSSSGFKLQSSPTLDPPTWTDVSGDPKSPASIPVSSHNIFYRVAKP